MSVKIGRVGWLGVAVESSAGSGGDTPVKYIPLTAQSFNNVIEVLDDEAAKGIRERAWGSVTARTRGEGDVTILLDAENAPYLLYAALGNMSSQCVEGGIYQHILTRKSGNPPRTLCFNINDTVTTRKYHYATANTCEISFTDGFAELTANVISQAPSAGSGTLAITEENVLAFKDAKIYFGSTFAEAQSNYQNDTNGQALSAFRLTINNNAEAHYTAGSSSPNHIAIGQFELGGDYTLFFEDTTEQSAHELQTPRSMVIAFTGGTIGTTTEKIIIEIPKFHITDRGIDTAPAGFVTQNPTFVGDYDSTYGSIVVKIVNQTQTYPGQIISSSSSCSSSSSRSSSSSSYSSSSSSSWSC